MKLGKSRAPVKPIDRFHLIQGCARVGGSAKHLLLTLGMLFNEEEGHAWASVKYLAYRFGVDKATIKRALSVLVNEEKLISRSLRKGDWAISRKTEIFWDKLHTRWVAFESTSKGPDGRVAKETAGGGTLEADIAVADTLDIPTDAPLISGKGRSSPDVENAAVALLRDCFSDHPTCQDKYVEPILHECVRECFKKAGSAESTLAILEWVCNDPANESKRASIRRSKKLGGYIKTCFKGWSDGFAAADQVNYPRY